MVTRSRYLALNHEIKQYLQQLDSRVKIQSFLCGNLHELGRSVAGVRPVPSVPAGDH
jgi:hypothetical protein